MTDRTSRAVAPVSAVCAAFRTQPSAYPQGAGKSDVAPTCGGVAETANAEEASLQAASGRKQSRKRRSRQKTEPQAAKQPAMDLSRDKNAEKMN